MKTTYYYGDIEFGRFSPQESTDSYPLAIIHRVELVKEFDTPEQAWTFFTEANCEFESYVGLDAKDKNDVQYEFVFKKHA